jgi:peptide/nickel transport system substrate-binding protein
VVGIDRSAGRATHLRCAPSGIGSLRATIATASSFFEPFSCDQFVPASGDSENIAEFCDPAVDSGRDAALAAQGAQANARWAALERRVLASAPAVPLFNPRNLMLVSDRVGNVQIHPGLGPLLDQLWVR